MVGPYLIAVENDPNGRITRLTKVRTEGYCIENFMFSLTQ